MAASMWMKVTTIMVLIFLTPACTRTIPWRFDTIDDAFPLGQPLPNDAEHGEIPLEADIVWDTAKATMQQHQWETLTADREMGVIRAKLYKTADGIGFVQVNAKEAGPALSEVRVSIMQQESCEIFSFIYYALKPVFWAASLGTFLWVDLTMGWTARELQKDRRFEERAALHRVRGNSNIPFYIRKNLETSGILNGTTQVQSN
jgi:hypothetical protein